MDVVDRFPSLRRNSFDRSAQGGLFHPLIGKPDPAKVPIAARVKDMKSKVLIAEPFGLFHNSCPKNLLRTHPMGSCPLGLDMTSKVLPGHLRDDRVLVKDVADSVQLLGPWMLHGRNQNRHLIKLSFAHFLVAPFSVLFEDRNLSITTAGETCLP